MLSYFHGVSSSDSYRGVHSHPGLPRPAVPGVSGRGRRRLESRSQDGGFPDRSTAMIYHCIMGWNWERWQIFCRRFWTNTELASNQGMQESSKCGIFKCLICIWIWIWVKMFYFIKLLDPDLHPKHIFCSVAQGLTFHHISLLPVRTTESNIYFSHANSIRC